jgi:hypothetical protein
LLDVKQTKDNGGTFEVLLSSRKRPKARVSQTEVDEEVRRLLTGED